MSNESTKKMLALYMQDKEPSHFFAGMFQSPRRNFHATETVEIDIVRSGEDIAIAIQDLSTGPRMNAADVFTNKEFTPPIFDEAFPINSWDLLKRTPGNIPFGDINFRRDLVLRSFNGMRKIERKIRRSLELQASQVLQLGVVTLNDAAGNAIYTIDYKPKATHLATSGVTWATATGIQKINDIDLLANVIRGDGLMDPDQLIFGDTAYRNFFEDAEVRIYFDTRRINQGALVPMNKVGNGGTYRGTFEIGNYSYDIWTYNGRYTNPADGVSTRFLDDGKVICRASSARMDATFGAVPNIGQLLGAQGGTLLPEIPGRMSMAGGGVDMFTNTWKSVDGRQLFGSVAARPLMIPTAIDTFGCLTTQL